MAESRSHGDARPEGRFRRRYIKAPASGVKTFFAGDQHRIRAGRGRDAKREQGDALVDGWTDRFFARWPTLKPACAR